MKSRLTWIGILQCSVAISCGPQAGSADAGDGRLAASIGPIHLNPGEEKTMCVVVRLNNETPRYVRRVSAHLGSASHHLIAYRSTQTAEQTTPVVCQGF